MDSKAREDLNLIRQVMDDSRRVVVDRGKHFLIWGVVPVVGLVATYVRATTGAGVDPLWVWTGVLAVGWAASMVVGWREGRTQRVSTLGRRILSAMWVSAGISLTLIALAGLFGGLVDGRMLPGLLATIMGAPVLVTGVLVGERWLTWVAAGWWVGGAIMLFIPGLYSLLLMATMSLLLLALPGVLLQHRARRREQLNGDAAGRA